MNHPTRVVYSLVFYLGVASTALSQSERLPGDEFASLLASREEMSFEQLRAEIQERPYLARLSFDPTKAKYYPEVSSELRLTQQEEEVFRRHGFVAVNHDQRYSFPSMYYAIYTRDLPVLITTDSVLHALHRSYEEILSDIEMYCFTPILENLLKECHERLTEMHGPGLVSTHQENYDDVDLYLTVARNLLTEKGQFQRGRSSARASNSLAVSSGFGHDAKVRAIVAQISSYQLQYPGKTSPTAIYGGERFIDYSQFRPRGHYATNYRLESYFKCMMWLSRADCGWNVEIADHRPNRVDADRELVNAALVVQLLQETGGISDLSEVDHVLDVMVGQDDDLTPMELATALGKGEIASLDQLTIPDDLTELRELIGKHTASQRIRSQVVMSDRFTPNRVSPPRVFQLFGQRFTFDAWILSHVVFDSIVVQDTSTPTGFRKIERMMPNGLDVMTALGNDMCVSLLEPELRRWRYTTNLSTLREYVQQRPQGAWTNGLYNIWLDCIRTLDDDIMTHDQAPDVMRTKAWQCKQLQTQLASWAELRHDMLLYGKQSYTGGPSCEYPTGYVEPYPQLYGRLEQFAEQAIAALSALPAPVDASQHRGFPDRSRIMTFFQKSRAIYNRLGALSRKELALQPFDESEQQWLKQTIDRKVSMSGPPSYTGWYCDLYYKHGWDLKKWCPTVADVHTDPESATVLQAAVGDAHFCAVAINSEDDHAVFVGPIYSYYEFVSEADKRLTDHEWQDMITQGDLPDRPAWFDDFHGPAVKREQGSKTKQFLDR